MKTTIKEITPQWAASVLSTKNPRNRPMSPQFVERLARDICNNGFLVTHQGIAFDLNGDLVDGQHRLAAVVKANRPVKMMVTVGMPATTKLNGISVNTFELIDGGRKRGVGQMLQMAGYGNGNRVAAVARVVVNLTAHRDQNFISITTVQTHKVLHFCKGSIEKCVALANPTSLFPVASGVIGAITFWHTVEPEKAESFIVELCGMTGPKDAPSRALATWLKRHISCGWSGAISQAKAAASAIYHQTRNHTPDKLYASDTATDWLMSLNKPLAKELSDLVRL